MSVLLQLLAFAGSDAGMAALGFIAKTGQQGLDFVANLAKSGLSDEEKLARWMKAVDAYNQGVSDWQNA